MCSLEGKPKRHLKMCNITVLGFCGLRELVSGLLQCQRSDVRSVPGSNWFVLSPTLAIGWGLSEHLAWFLSFLSFLFPRFWCLRGPLSIRSDTVEGKVCHSIDQFIQQVQSNLELGVGFGFHWWAGKKAEHLGVGEAGATEVSGIAQPWTLGYCCEGQHTMPRDGQVDVWGLLYLEAGEGLSEEVMFEQKSGGWTGVLAAPGVLGRSGTREGFETGGRWGLWHK